MKRAIMGAALAAVLCAPALADNVQIVFRNPIQAPPPNRAVDALLDAQLADALTTRILLQSPRGYERDPILRGVVRSDAGALGAVLVTNFLARVLFRRSPAVLDGFTALEAGLVVNNLRAISR